MVKTSRVLLPGPREQLKRILSSSGRESSPQDEWAAVLGAVLANAMAQHHWGLARSLVGAGAKVGGGSLCAAVRSGQHDLVAVLVENGAPVDGKDAYSGDCCLHVAVHQGDAGMVRLLLQGGADINCRDTWEKTPLHAAAAEGHAGLAELLLEEGADRDADDFYQWKPILHATDGPFPDVVRVLMEAGADASGISDKGSTPLHWVAAANTGESQIRLLKLMIDLGEDVHAADCRGEQAIHCASGRAAVNALLDAGADIEATTTPHGLTPLMCTAHRRIEGEAAHALVDRGADFNARDGHGWSALHYAATWAHRRGGVEMVDFLLRSGADETAENNEGQAATDLVGHHPRDIYRPLAPANAQENIDRARRLLANAPAERAWRRRGLLVLCLARHRREQHLLPEANSANDIREGGGGGADDTRKKSRDSEQQSNAGGPADETSEHDDGGWACAAGWVMRLGLGNEGAFRAIVGYL